MACTRLFAKGRRVRPVFVASTTPQPSRAVPCRIEAAGRADVTTAGSPAWAPEASANFFNYAHGKCFPDRRGSWGRASHGTPRVWVGGLGPTIAHDLGRRQNLPIREQRVTVWLAIHHLDADRPVIDLAGACIDVRVTTGVSDVPRHSGFRRKPKLIVHVWFVFIRQQPVKAGVVGFHDRDGSLRVGSGGRLNDDGFDARLRHRYDWPCCCPIGLNARIPDFVEQHVRWTSRSGQIEVRRELCTFIQETGMDGLLEA